MLVRPCRVTAGCMDHPKDGVGANEVPRINWGAALAGIAFQPLGVNRLNPSINTGWCAAIELRFIDVDAFVEFRRRARRHPVRHTRSPSYAISGCYCWSIKRAVISDIVEGPCSARGAAAYQRRKAGKRVRRL